MVWPLNCLENDSRLLEKFKDFKLKPDHLKGLDQDSNFSTFLRREENAQMLRRVGSDLYQRCEGLLQFEYLLLKERAKNVIVKENYEKEIEAIQAEKEELYKDRERYSKVAALELSI
jgi:hypothetical protein